MGSKVGQELERRAEVLNPITGELIEVADREKMAGAFEALRELKANADVALARFTEAVVEEVARIGSRTLTGDGGLKLVLGPDTEVEWDVPALSALRDAGLPEERMNDLVKTTVTFKVDAAVAKQLSSANPAYAAIIEAAKQRVPKRPYVQVKRR